MAISMKNWKDRITQYPNRRKLINVSTGEETLVDVVRAEGNVTEAGDTFTAANMTDFENKIYNAIYPVGSIYISVNNTNPSTLFGGTWVAFGEGRTLIGMGNNGTTDYTTVEATGGQETVKLTSAESGVPAHSHVACANVSSVEHSGDSLSTGGSFENRVIVSMNYTAGKSNTLIENNTAADASQAHSNLQPYITCYMWKRTA